jgi:hypothetical protein
MWRGQPLRSEYLLYLFYWLREQIYSLFAGFVTEQSFQYLESWFVLALSGKIDLDRVRDRVKKTKIELKIKLNCVYGHRSNKYPYNISSSKALRWRVKTLGDPGLSKYLSKLAAFGRLCRSKCKVVTLLEYPLNKVYSDYYLDRLGNAKIEIDIDRDPKLNRSLQSAWARFGMRLTWCQQKSWIDIDWDPELFRSHPVKYLHDKGSR